MNPRTRCIALLVVVAALLPCQRANAATVRVQVGQGGLKFTPRTVFIQPGDTDGLWDSDVQNRGFTFSQTFPSAGAFGTGPLRKSDRA